MKHFVGKNSLSVDRLVRSNNIRDVFGFSGFHRYYTKFSRYIESNPNCLARFTKMESFAEKDMSNVISDFLLHNIKNSAVDQEHLLFQNSVSQMSKADILESPQDGYGKIIVASKEKMRFLHGPRGIMPSKEVSVQDLLKDSFDIEENSFGVIDCLHHVPFKLEIENPKETFLLPLSQIDKFHTHEQNIKRYSFSHVMKLPSDLSKRLQIKIQDVIYSDRFNESFYEEVTSVVSKPTHQLRSSGTLMNFESISDDEDKKTDIHHHPGERFLIILTVGKKSGAILNFCGVAEDPDERTDCNVDLDFPKNSLVILSFPPFVHHKFKGDFVCLSVHPRDGKNFIDMVQSGKLTKGFLETATVFSSTKENQEKWNLEPAISLQNFKLEQSHSRAR